MANVTFQIKVNGSFQNFSDCIREGGLKWEDNDLDAEGSGRDLAGLMHRNRVAIKDALTITTIPLKTARISALLTALRQGSFQVKYLNPQTGSVVTQTMYNSSRVSTCEREYVEANGTHTQLWDSITFKLIEV